MSVGATPFKPNAPAFNPNASSFNPTATMAAKPIGASATFAPTGQNFGQNSFNTSS